MRVCSTVSLPDNNRVLPHSFIATDVIFPCRKTLERLLLNCRLLEAFVKVEHLIDMPAREGLQKRLKSRPQREDDSLLLKCTHSLINAHSLSNQGHTQKYVKIKLFKSEADVGLSVRTLSRSHVLSKVTPFIEFMLSNSQP